MRRALKDVRVDYAFKEWAVIVEALACGRQTIILRKGGIHESSGGFEMERSAFFLFPTFEHQNPADIIESERASLEKTIRQSHRKSEAIPIQFLARVRDYAKIEDQSQLALLRSLHIWSDEAVRKRFQFGREKMIHAMRVRIYRLPEVFLLENKPSYGGCKSWVRLEETISDKNAKPVLSDREFDSTQDIFFRAKGDRP